MCRLICLIILLLAQGNLVAKAPKKIVINPTVRESTHLKSLYNGLDPTSISENLAFYQLYSDTPEGKQALTRAWKLLAPDQDVPMIKTLSLPYLDIRGIISLVTKQPFQAPVQLEEDQLQIIDKISAKLSNRKLKGSTIWTLEKLEALPAEEIDLGRALLICQYPNPLEQKNALKNYEASLDLMSLQILARLPKNPTDLDKIKEITRYIFQEMQFRFPPHSLHAQDIDLYTFLPSVLDSRQGVCLGVSILYLSLAQRIDLPLEIVTPPGHIYVRYRNGDQVINIETTARGIDVPSETYLGVNTRSLQERNLRHVVGLAFVNQASVAWGKEDYKTCVTLYEKAVPFLPEDPLLKMFLGLNYLFIGKTAEGKALLKQIRNLQLDFAVSPETLPEDFLSGHVNVEGLKTIFMNVDETRESILNKQEKLKKILKRYPSFRAGLLQLAVTHLQLGRGSEAQKILEKYYTLDKNDATVAYYLAMLHIERYNYTQAWDYLKQATQLTQERDHHPKALKSLSDFLKRTCPDPLL